MHIKKLNFKDLDHYEIININTNCAFNRSILTKMCYKIIKNQSPNDNERWQYKIVRDDTPEQWSVGRCNFTMKTDNTRRNDAVVDIELIYIDPKYRNGEIVQMCLTEILKDAYDNGCTHVTLSGGEKCYTIGDFDIKRFLNLHPKGNLRHILFG